jgi:type II secretory pathway component PulM
MEMIRDWWASKSENERRIVVLLGVISVSVLFWAGLLAPLQQLRASAIDRYERSSDTLLLAQNVQSEAQRLKAAPQADRSSDPIRQQPLRQVIPYAAGRHALPIARVVPEGDNQITVWVEGVDARRVYAFVDYLESSAGVRLLRIQLSHIANGEVRGSMLLRKDA